MLNYLGKNAQVFSHNPLTMISFHLTRQGEEGMFCPYTDQGAR